ncbi:MAG TPA: isopentenyl-diphosphate delta-isomerase [Cryomorphaceae bacterium]|nr:isopentenyl-diphosphate delta-isomerase [Owenweeksia sp.]MBF97907.1 isopentenyl-diphosphate delta-isomerase [Owenweeksia sp.]HAD97230.1 isopentenyl-diphosphate delta-isomerase [Cryomorphaceae bacterium]HBF20051.1 isopentenyl-diphosphate delta-isomerase [Cryomorphaceae bacterium]HCQ14731.1 isopentenyl-diphosphate delta-isomerase [Cryomorphaceae bacterium]|tara:strand:+ start:59 stop:586 length:528 start_codon:yes stop_codon:yes gene_type:complete
MIENVVLVDEHDNELGLMEKMEAHRQGLLHRAFSVFILNSNGELMMQQRAFHKYHSGGLWTNTCCSHPRHNERPEDAAHRRLQEEMGFDCPLNKLFDFVYRAEFDNDMTEHEFDHLYVGYSDSTPRINPDEVASWKWMSLEELERDMAVNSDDYTEWFKIIFNRFVEKLKEGSWK